MVDASFPGLVSVVYLFIITSFAGTKIKQNWGTQFEFVIMYKEKLEKLEEVRTRDLQGGDNDV